MSLQPSNLTKLYVRDNSIWIDIKKTAIGKRVRRSLKLSDLTSNWNEARSLQLQIESDISTNDFDFSFKKYIPKRYKTLLTLSELWDKYIQFKRKYWSPSTYNNTALMLSKKFALLNNQDLRSPNLIKSELLRKYSVNVASRSCQQIKAAVNWGLEEGILYDIEWTISKKSFKSLLKKSSTNETDINPFSIEERDLILEAFRTNMFAKRNKTYSHSQYYLAIKFWFLTGCRTGELLGLEWSDIYPKYILFSKNRIVTSQGEIVKEGLKTQRRRKFPINSQLQDLLNDLGHKKTGYVFRNKKGKPLILSTLVKAWAKVLENLELTYRRPYQCRHTFISICLNSRKLSPTQVAKLVGTSTAMIYKHYLGTSEDIEVPIL